MAKQNEHTKLLLTGGHAGATAFAVIEEINKRHKNWEIFWIGAGSAVEGKSIVPLEKKVLPEMGVSYLTLYTGRLQRRFTVWSIPSLLKIPIGFVHAFFYLLKLKPELILSFGGFVAFPVVLVGRILKIPILIHEQTFSAGLANRLSSPFADKILLARKESTAYFPEKKCDIVGNPVSSKVMEIKPKLNLSSIPTLLITGGSRGAKIINSNVEKTLDSLLKSYKIVHQTGEAEYEKFLFLKKRLNKGQKERYEVYPVIEKSKWQKFLERSDMVLSRSGANIVTELLIVKRPAVLVPLPRSAGNEQFKNALMAEKVGVARILEQKDLNKKSLLKELAALKNNWRKMIKKAKKYNSPDLEASEKVVNEIEKRLK